MHVRRETSRRQARIAGAETPKQTVRIRGTKRLSETERGFAWCKSQGLKRGAGPAKQLLGMLCGKPVLYRS